MSLNFEKKRMMDQVSLEEIFALRIPMLRSCPYFLRCRVRESFNFALRERLKARLEGDVEAEIRVLETLWSDPEHVASQTFRDRFNWTERIGTPS